MVAMVGVLWEALSWFGGGCGRLCGSVGLGKLWGLWEVVGVVGVVGGCGEFQMVVGSCRRL